MKKQERINSSSSRSTDNTFYVENLGCSKNQVDAEILSSRLETSGWTLTSEPTLAGLIIVNTCGFIESAKEESIAVTLDLRRRFPGKKIIMAGCLAERYGRELYQSMPEVDGFFGNGAPGAITGVVDAVVAGNRDIDIPEHRHQYSRRNNLFSFPGSAYVKIAEGCSNRCSYCAIPRIRGTLRSREKNEIIAEVKELLQRGIREIVLIAQDLGAYGTDLEGPELADLLEGLLELSGDFWIRMLYIHPDHFPMRITDLMRQDSRLIPYLDIPFQHASAGILEQMNRRGDEGRYLKLIDAIRERVPDVVIRSTFLLGFPGETESDFSTLESFIRRARLSWAGFFTYSREEDTPAYSMISEQNYRRTRKMSEDRVRRLQRVQERITWDYLDSLVGKSVSVLLEEPIRGEPVWLGRGYMSAPEVDGLVVVKTGADSPDLEAGERVEIRITGRNGVDLEGMLQ